MATETTETAAPNLDLERRKLELENALKELEVQEKTRELNKRHGFFSRLNVTIPEATLFVGILGFLGSFAGSYLQQDNQIRIKEREARSQLVLEAMKGDDTTKNLMKLRFLIDAGFLEDDQRTITNLILSGKYGSGLSAPSSPSLVDAMITGNAPKLLKEVVAIIREVPDIDLVDTNDFPAVAAMTKKDGRMLLMYDRSALERVASNQRNNWTIAAIISHEIGHATLNHFEVRERCPQVTTACIRATELEADRYAGFVLRQLGASIEEAKASYSFLPDLPEAEGSVHPPKSERIEAIAAGWNAPLQVRANSRQ